MEDTKKTLVVTGLSEYWQTEFKKIYNSNESYKGKWNWWAFLFTGIWCILKGCWVYAILFFVTDAILNYSIEVKPGVHLTIYFVTLVWMPVMGWRGNWIYYNVKIKKKQFPKL